MRVRNTVLLGAALGLAACANTAGQSAASKDDPQDICHIDAQDLHPRGDTAWLVTYTVKNANRWCFNGIANYSGKGASAADLTESPVHGEARIINEAGGTFMGYRPFRGYTGSDHFVVSLWLDQGLRVAYTVSVVVLPPPPDLPAKAGGPQT
jgi:hypothetical protein